MTWHDMTWHDMTWHDMTWYDMTMCGVTFNFFSVRLSWFKEMKKTDMWFITGEGIIHKYIHFMYHTWIINTYYTQTFKGLGFFCFFFFCLFWQDSSEAQQETGSGGGLTCSKGQQVRQSPCTLALFSTNWAVSFNQNYIIQFIHINLTSSKN